MLTRWTDNIKDPAEKAAFESSVKSAKPILARLTQIIKDQEDALDRSESDVAAFDTPNWAYLQAYKNGQRSTYRTAKALLNIDLDQ